MNQRYILLTVIIVSAIATIALNEANADKEGTGWFDARNFYKKIRSMDIFESYPYDSPTLTVKIVNTGSPTKDKFLVEYASHSKIIKIKDDETKLKFDIDSKDKRKVCMTELKTDFQKCKKFDSYDDKNSITFYIR